MASFAAHFLPRAVTVTVTVNRASLQFWLNKMCQLDKRQTRKFVHIYVSSRMGHLEHFFPVLSHIQSVEGGDDRRKNWVVGHSDHSKIEWLGVPDLSETERLGAADLSVSERPAAPSS